MKALFFLLELLVSKWKKRGISVKNEEKPLKRAKTFENSALFTASTPHKISGISALSCAFQYKTM